MRKVGACRLLDELGRGGMAIVYRGVHESLQREVAIKELLPGGEKDKETLSRFRREALALAAFRHQNIVTLYDLVEKNDGLFMIMELVDGPTLSELLREGPIPPEVTAVIGDQLASALDHAHFHRIIHRDLKPSNIMLTRWGEVKLMDFGIAKDEELDALTKKGMAVGTPAYMSPEQVVGAPLDPRTDIYSLGVVLYECLTGEKPFVGTSAGEIFAKVRDGKYKKLSKAAPQVPPALRAAVQRAMRNKPNDRYFEASALRRDLEVYLARSVKVSQSALLLAFLRHRKRLTETEALARLTGRELALVDQFDRVRWPHKGRLRWAVAMLAAGGAALYWTQAKWLPLFNALWTLKGK